MGNKSSSNPTPAPTSDENKAPKQEEPKAEVKPEAPKQEEPKAEVKPEAPKRESAQSDVETRTLLGKTYEVTPDGGFRQQG